MLEHPVALSSPNRSIVPSIEEDKNSNTTSSNESVIDKGKNKNDTSDQSSSSSSITDAISDTQEEAIQVKTSESEATGNESVKNSLDRSIEMTESAHANENDGTTIK